MLREWDKQYPKRLHSIFGALQNVSPSQLADREVYKVPLTFFMLAFIQQQSLSSRHLNGS
jgi:hypothetical protein